MQKETVVLKELWETIKLGDTKLVKSKSVKIQKMFESWKVLKVKIFNWIKTERNIIIDKWVELQRLGNLCITDAKDLIINHNSYKEKKWMIHVEEWITSKTVFVKEELKKFEVKLSVVEEALDILVKTKLKTVVDDHGILKSDGFELLFDDAWTNLKNAGADVDYGVKDWWNSGVKEVDEVVTVDKDAVLLTDQTVDQFAITGVNSIGGIIKAAKDVVWSFVKGSRNAIYDLIWRL